MPDGVAGGRLLNTGFDKRNYSGNLGYAWDGGEVSVSSSRHLLTDMGHVLRWTTPANGELEPATWDQARPYTTGNPEVKRDASTMSKQFHAVIGVFFLPMLLIYIFTGLMFVSGQRSRGEVREEIIEAEWPDGREGQLALAKSYLAERGLKNPPERLRSEPRFFFWGHSGAFSLALRPDPAEGRVIAQIYEPTFYSRLMSLHSNRARGGGFQAFAVLFCLGWLASYAGIIFRKPKKRARRRYLPLGAGFLVTAWSPGSRCRKIQGPGEGFGFYRRGRDKKRAGSSGAFSFMKTP